MMASNSAVNAAKLWKTVKPHVPLIKFRNHKSQEGTSQSVPTATSSIVVGGASQKGSGIDEDHLPPKYARKPMTQIEMEYIERGGPE